MAKLNIYSFLPATHSASYYYRLQVPLLTAAEMGLPINPIIDTDRTGIPPEMRAQQFCEADIILLYQPFGEPTVHNVRGAKSFLPSKRDGSWKYPPTLIVDSDDNIFNVNPHNAAFRHLGFRDHEGNDIPPGHTIGCLQGGERKILWKDGEEGFDLTRNRHSIDTYRTMIELADAVTTSTKPVADAILRDAAPRKLDTFPNLMRLDHYPQVDLMPDRKRLKILWQGGGAHYEDWYPLRGALGSITKKYPHVHWIIWGAQYHWVNELIPPDRYTYVPWCDYREFKLRRVMFGEDISLAPLTDNRFNRCRSAIKFYEASVAAQPAATLAQRTGAYAEEIIDGQTALLFGDPAEFESQLSLLIENAGLRASLADNAKDWVSEHRDAFKHVPKIVAHWEMVREQVQRDHPHMSDTDWDRFVAEMEAQEEAAAVEQPNGVAVG